MKKRAFTLIELLVVVAIIALLMSILMPVLAKVKRQATQVACVSRLHQWGLVMSLYTGENNGFFYTRKIGDPEGYKKMWIQVLQPFYKDPIMRCCPAAESRRRSAPDPFGVWGGDAWLSSKFGAWVPDKDVYGSYAMSRHVLELDRSTYPNNWGRADIKGGNRVPVFMDNSYVYTSPNSNSDPPDYNGDWGSDMKQTCLDRHGGGSMNSLFLDWSARKVLLKELWTFKWNRVWNTCDIWTKCGKAKQADWPQWMRSFKAF